MIIINKLKKSGTKCQSAFNCFQAAVASDHPTTTRNICNIPIKICYARSQLHYIQAFELLTGGVGFNYHFITFDIIELEVGL